MYFIGNTCFRRKIVYHNKMHLHYSSLKERVAPSSIKLRTYVFKKVSFTERNYTYVFLILTRGLLFQKSRLVFYDVNYVIIYDIIYFMLAFLLFSSWIELAGRNCLLSWIQTYLNIFLQATPFYSAQLQRFLTFHQLSVKCCLGSTWYISTYVYI